MLHKIEFSALSLFLGAGVMQLPNLVNSNISVATFNIGRRIDHMGRAHIF
jgi:hypothetical protein